jgi:hypothetical protein
MRGFSFASLLFTASLFQGVTLGAVTPDNVVQIVERQTNIQTQCADYSRIANLSTIGSNSTLRASFLQNAPAGTLISAALLNDAIAKLPPLTRDPDLNENCGNLTQLALDESARNFSQGTVAEFTNVDPKPQAIDNGIPVIFCCSMAMLLIGCTALFLE